MTRSQQKLWEQHYLDLFAKLWPDFPRGTPTPADPPAPDFLLTLADRIVGIELTAFIWDATESSGSPGHALHSLHDRTVQRAKYIWESRHFPAVDVGLIWNHHQKLLVRDVDPLAEQLVELVARHVPPIDGHVPLAYPEPGWKELPRHTVAVFVSRPAWLHESTWNFFRGGAVHHLRNCHGRLQSILDQKEPKIVDYRRHCEEVWLLIVADALNIQSLVVIEEDLPEHNLTTSLDRAFFLSAMYQTQTELSLTKRL